MKKGRRTSVVFMLVAMLVSAAALAEEPKAPAPGPLEQYAKLTRGITKACFEMKLTLANGPMKGTAVVKYWLDTERALWRLDAALEIQDPEKNHKLEQSLFFSPNGSVRWGRADGGKLNVEVLPKSEMIPGKFSAPEGAGPALAWFDATFGYENIAAKTVVKRVEESPLKEKDKLHWFKIEPRAEFEAFYASLCGGPRGTELWLGLSPETGWPAACVVRSAEMTGTVEMTKADLKPNLEKAFELPPEVKAKMDAKPEQPTEKE